MKKCDIRTLSFELKLSIAKLYWRNFSSFFLSFFGSFFRLWQMCFLLLDTFSVKLLFFRILFFYFEIWNFSWIFFFWKIGRFYNGCVVCIGFEANHCFESTNVWCMFSNGNSGNERFTILSPLCSRGCCSRLLLYFVFLLLLFFRSFSSVVRAFSCIFRSQSNTKKFIW